MRIPTYAIRRQERGDEAMTPMIDVVFLLLIFFVCAAAGQIKEAVLPTELTAPGEVSAEAAAERDPWVVEVWLTISTDESGTSTVDMNGLKHSPVEMVAKPLRDLADVSADSPVILQIGQNVPMRDWVAVYDLCEASGFESVNFAVSAEDVRTTPGEAAHSRSTGNSP